MLHRLKWFVAIFAFTTFTVACGKGHDDGTPAKPLAGSYANKAAYPNVANTVYGGWQAPREQGNGGVFTPQIYINQNGEFTVSMECETAKNRLVATATARAQITANQIQILSRAEQTFTANGESCTVTIQPATIGYQVVGNVLKVTNPNNGQTGQLSRLLY